MEPRGRRAHRVYRMGNAVNFMAPMGFAADLVEKTVDSLLKEYGGPQGWRFIEDNSYAVLLERLLEEEDTEENHEEIDNAREDEADGHVSLAANNDAGPSRPTGAEDAATGESGLNNGMVLSTNSSYAPSPPAAEDPDIGDQEALTPSSPTGNSVPQPKRRREPCYGWISEESDEDEEEEEVEPKTETGRMEKPFPLPPKKRHGFDGGPNQS